MVCSTVLQLSWIGSYSSDIRSQTREHVNHTSYHGVCVCHYEKSSSNVVVVDNTKMIDTVQTTTPRLNECCFIPTLTSVCQPCSLICITYHVSRTSQLVCNVCLCQSIPASSLRMMLSQLPMIGFLSNAGFRMSTMLIDMYHISRTSKLVTTVCVCVCQSQVRVYE